jgi:hypothetical protein
MKVGIGIELSSFITVNTSIGFLVQCTNSSSKSQMRRRFSGILQPISCCLFFCLLFCNTINNIDFYRFSPCSSSFLSTRSEKRRRSFFTPFRSTASSRRGSIADLNPGQKTPAAAGMLTYGEGRTIPVKQGLLFKRSGRRDQPPSHHQKWREKYVELSRDGVLAYYPSLAAYLENQHRKEVRLHCVTVKVPGQKPTGLASVPGQKPTGLASVTGQKPSGLASVPGQKPTGLASVPGQKPNGLASVPGQKHTGLAFVQGQKPTGLASLDNAATATSFVGGRTSMTMTPSLSVSSSCSSVAANANNPCIALSPRIGHSGAAGATPVLAEFQIVSVNGRTWSFGCETTADRDSWLQVGPSES